MKPKVPANPYLWYEAPITSHAGMQQRGH